MSPTSGITMGNSAHKFGKISEASADGAIAFLRQLYPVKTGAHVEADTGISADTYRKWEDGIAKPSWSHVWRLICRYGPAFMCAVLPNPPEWLDADRRAERQRQLDHDIAQLVAERDHIVGGGV
jgi:hypothetical protein